MGWPSEPSQGSQWAEAIGRFGVRCGTTPRQAFCQEVLRGLEQDSWQLPPEQVAERFKAVPEPMPHTLSDCFMSWPYWNELYRLRNACDTQGYYENSIEAHARDWFVFGLLAELRPRNREEARATLRYLMGSERTTPRGRRDLGEPARVIFPDNQDESWYAYHEPFGSSH